RTEGKISEDYGVALPARVAQISTPSPKAWNKPAVVRALRGKTKPIVSRKALTIVPWSQGEGRCIFWD
ncbi:MAG: hypothetical protein CV045_10595, partial [Cyanobacteria bacterium M5B4]